jgi:hypothetical protein
MIGDIEIASIILAVGFIASAVIIAIGLIIAARIIRNHSQ